MRALLLAVAVSSAALGQPVTVAPWMTGARLLGLYAAEPSRAIAGPYGKYSEAERVAVRETVSKASAAAYVDGVHDATEGKAWCYSVKASPHPDELQSEALWGLRALPPEQLKRNAADLIVDIWRKKWPCGAKP